MQGPLKTGRSSCIQWHKFQREMIVRHLLSANPTLQLISIIKDGNKIGHKVEPSFWTMMKGTHRLRSYISIERHRNSYFRPWTCPRQWVRLLNSSAKTRNSRQKSTFSSNQRFVKINTWSHSTLSFYSWVLKAAVVIWLLSGINYTCKWCKAEKLFTTWYTKLFII